MEGILGRLVPFRRSDGRLFSFASLLLAVLLAVTAALKASDVVSRSVVAVSTTFVAATVLLVGIELALAGWLASGTGPRQAWVTSVGLVSVFTIVASHQLLSGASDCGCFGAFRVHPSWTVALDGACLGILWVSRPRWAKALPGVPAIRACGFRIAFVGALFAGVLAARLIALPETDKSVVLLQPDEWVGRRLPIEAALRFSDGTIDFENATLVLFDPACGTCKHLLADKKFRRGVESGATILVSLVAPPAGGIPSGPVKPNVWLDESRRWLADVPVEIRISNGTVAEVRSIH